MAKVKALDPKDRIINFINAMIDSDAAELTTLYARLRIDAAKIPEGLELVVERTSREEDTLPKAPKWVKIRDSERHAYYEYNIERIGDCAEAIKTITDRINNLTKIKLHLFDDVDFSGGEYYLRRISGIMNSPFETN